MRTAICALCVWGACFLVIQPAAGQKFYLPLELEQGLAFAEGVDPYRFSLRLHPTYGIGDGKWRVAVSSALVYTNPRWAWQGGGRISYKVATLQFQHTDALSLHLGLEGLWESDRFLGSQNRTLLGGSVMLNIFGPAVLGVRVQHDSFIDSWGLGGFIGFHLNAFRKTNSEDDIE